MQEDTSERKFVFGSPTETQSKTSFKDYRPSSVLIEALRLLDQDRYEDYGPPDVSCQEIAYLWSLLFKMEITKEQVALALAAMKFRRLLYNLTHDSKRAADSAVDLMAYLEMWARFNGQ